jgi:prolipoprotein diacylglyceryltransferase
MFWLWKHRALSGRLVFVFIGTYAVWRFGVEFVRVRDEHLFGLLSIYQFISIGLLVICTASLLVPRFLVSLLSQRAKR